MKITILVLGLLLLLLGVWGLFTDSILGMFDVNLAHAVVHILTGIVLILMAMKDDAMAVLGAKIFGVVYALVAILGFVAPAMMMEYLAANMADHILHLVFALIFLGIGFLGGKKDQLPAM